MRRLLMTGFAASLALSLASCGDPETVIEPFASHSAYEFTRAEVEAGGGWLDIAELEHDAVDDAPGVQVWGDGPQDADDDDDGPQEPYTRWDQLPAEDYRLTNGRLYIYLSGDDSKDSRHYRVVISRRSLKL
ncbi:MAG TPA: hypothetical protein ENN88_02975 [Candidatus Coatesbacteria bacterium]|nr:hypothetical protein [Candidatus Coatesbacteria bacterium]